MTVRFPSLSLIGFATIAALSFSGCANLQPAQRAEPMRFNMDARMATDFGETQSEKNVSGDMRWEEYPSSTDITFSTPFGNTMALVQLTPTEATFKGADGSVVRADTPEELFYRLFGMDLPLANLHEWIGTANTPLAKVRDVQGWHVVVTDTFENPNLAKRLEISRTAPEVMTLTVAILERSDRNASANANTNANTSANTSAIKPNNEFDLNQLLPQTPPKPATSTLRSKQRK